MLLEKGADVHAKTNDGHTPLYSACEEGYTEVALVLLEKGADVHAQNSMAALLCHRRVTAAETCYAQNTDASKDVTTSGIYTLFLRS